MAVDRRTLGWPARALNQGVGGGQQHLLQACSHAPGAMPKNGHASRAPSRSERVMPSV